MNLMVNANSPIIFGDVDAPCQLNREFFGCHKGERLKEVSFVMNLSVDNKVLLQSYNIRLGSFSNRKNGIIQLPVVLSDGTRKYVYGKTEDAIMQKLNPTIRRFIKEMEERVEDEFRLQQYVKHYLETFFTNSVRPTTYNRYVQTMQMLSGHPIADMSIRKISIDDIQKYIDHLCTSKESSMSTMIKARDQLKMVFRYAMSKGDVSRNPTEGIKMPIPLKPTKDVKPPEEDAQDKLCAALTLMHNEKPIYRLGWAGVLLLETGMRVGELLASEWCDLSKDGYELFIHQTLETVHGKTSIYPSTKTEEGTRYVQLNQRARQAVQKLKEVTGKWEYLTATENGTLTTYRNFERMIETACIRAKIDKLSCHPLRHAFASNAEKRGASSRDIAAQLGHTNDTLVRTRYSSIYEADRRESMRRATGD